ncbi:hypothetical protein F5Y18DRAFT_377385 [Xylariaceae sp. FL1019]|nr:hypothetical protein F5Y18DRAFT_377385 [Xylariaceae sp. FL1019]
MTESKKTPQEIADAAKQNAAFYLTEIPPELESARRLLGQYSGIEPDDIDTHIRHVRDKAWAVFPYSGIGSFKFLDMTSTVQDPMFQVVTDRLRAAGNTERFLDVGCCLGHVVRQLIVEGVPSERVYGVDLQPRFLDFGYDIFCDRDKSQATYIAGDMLSQDRDLDVLKGKVDIIYASAFFHLFERDDQLKAAKRMVEFLNLENPNVLIFGQNGGPKIAGWERYVLDEDSWKQLWDEVGQMTGTSWSTVINSEESEDRITRKFAVHRLA